MNYDKINLLVDNTTLKDYKLIKKELCNSPFYVWQKIKNKKPVSEYIRIVLINDPAFSQDYYWNLETSFKPFKHKWNSRPLANRKSSIFTDKEPDKAYNYFLNLFDMLNHLKR